MSSLVCILSHHHPDLSEGYFVEAGAIAPCFRCGMDVTIAAAVLQEFRYKQEVRMRTLFSSDEPLNPALNKIFKDRFWKDSEKLQFTKEVK